MGCLKVSAGAYYNEIDPYAAQWLRNLISAGHIAPGDVDERSIEDVSPDDMRGYAQCHFFAGIGVWSYALRRAGWPDERPVWTGSCPCQPFSAAGKGGGFADERHLWPAWFHLIGERRPSVVLGEQVASKDGLAWLDLVQADLEGTGYAVGAVDTCSAGSGAPHIRQRLRFVAERVAHHHHQGLEGRGGESERRAECAAGPGSVAGGLADDDREGCGEQSECDRRALGRGTVQQRSDANGRGGILRDGRPGPTNGFWRDADWLFCRDGKWRPVEPGTFPLAHGAAARVGRLRAYGNAVDAEATRIFIQAYIETAPRLS